MAMTRPIGQGEPSANAATSAAPAIPPPYWSAPTTAEALPAARFTEANAPATALAAISPFIAVKPRLTATRPATPCQSVAVTAAKASPMTAAPKAPIRSIRSAPICVTSLALIMFAAIRPAMPDPKTSA